jgi:hypothetical protein
VTNIDQIGTILGALEKFARGKGRSMGTEYSVPALGRSYEALADWVEAPAGMP